MLFYIIFGELVNICCDNWNRTQFLTQTKRKMLKIPTPQYKIVTALVITPCKILSKIFYVNQLYLKVCTI